jgi:hypothetical protein
MLLGCCEFGKNRKGKDFETGGFGNGKVAGFVAEIGEGLLKMQRLRVVDFRREALEREIFAESIALFCANSELIIDV